MSQKHVGHFYFCDNFGKSGPIIIFSMLTLERIWGESQN